MVEERSWPDTIWIVRHGESAGNVARREAEAAGEPVIQIATRDIDVPLSMLGEQQARALGRWFGSMPDDKKPTAVLASPYLRARQTVMAAMEEAGMDQEHTIVIVDERLREKEFGILDRLTRIGIMQKYPDQAEYRSALGKFYHRPPGGESWCDVLLRLRSVTSTVSRDYSGERLLIVCHQVVVLCFRYLLERMTEEQILGIDRAHNLANCSVTSYEYEPSADEQGKLALRLFNFVAPLEEAGAAITREPDAPVAPR